MLLCACGALDEGLRDEGKNASDEHRMVWPCSKGAVTSSFKWRDLHNSGECRAHKGIDIVSEGRVFDAPILAPDTGWVERVVDGCPAVGALGSSCGGGFGNHVILCHGDPEGRQQSPRRCRRGYRSTLAHLRV